MNEILSVIAVTLPICLFLTGALVYGLHRIIQAGRR